MVIVVMMNTIFTSPPDLVLFILLNKAHTFKHIRDIVDSSLLDCKLSNSIIQVNALLGSLFDKLNELLGELDQSILLSGSLAQLIE